MGADARVLGETTEEAEVTEGSGRLGARCGGRSAPVGRWGRAGVGKPLLRGRPSGLGVGACGADGKR